MYLRTVHGIDAVLNHDGGFNLRRYKHVELP